MYMVIQYWSTAGVAADNLPFDDAACNSLPDSLKDTALSLYCFENHLKTFLFPRYLHTYCTRCLVVECEVTGVYCAVQDYQLFFEAVECEELFKFLHIDAPQDEVEYIINNAPKEEVRIL